ncbi:MAG TPA: hypothetical protein VGI34_04165 [Candidatus Acidoferrales bacterium]
MNLQTQVAETARRIRIALGRRGIMTPEELELTVDASPQILDSALGWLACEGLVELLSEDNRTKVRLKFT